MFDMARAYMSEELLIAEMSFIIGCLLVELSSLMETQIDHQNGSPKR